VPEQFSRPENSPERDPVRPQNYEKPHPTCPGLAVPEKRDSHHASANGQVEQVNSTLEQYLRIYCNYEQDNQSKLLPLAEFAYNNAPHATTGVFPFFATRGYDPDANKMRLLMKTE
jgi:hypothetical protein